MGREREQYHLKIFLWEHALRPPSAYVLTGTHHHWCPPNRKYLPPPMMWYSTARSGSPQDALHLFGTGRMPGWNYGRDLESRGTYPAWSNFQR